MQNLITILFFLFLCTQSNDSEVVKDEDTVSSGPANGKLLIGGGGMTDDLWQVFKENGGGDTARLVVIPTSWDENSINYDPTFSIIHKQFLKRGFQKVDVLHTRDSSVANTEEFVAPIKNATAVWLSGGRQWRSADVYLDTKVHDELVKLLARGGIIGGHSAGASIQGSFMVRGRRDEFGSYYIKGGQERGFGFLKNSAIDQHHIIRNRHYEMFEVLRERPQLLGLGIDENTAILVQNDTFEVIGDRYVTVYDGTFWSPYFNEIVPLSKGEEKFYFLSNGNKYDLNKRRVIVNKYLEPKTLTARSELKMYVGEYQLGDRRFKFSLVADTLRLQHINGSIAKEPIPIFPNGNDQFFDKESDWWYHFQRDGSGQITAVTRRMNRLIDDKIQTLTKRL